MLVELTRILNNVTVNSKEIDSRNLMLVTKITGSAEDGRGTDALMLQLVAVQQDDELDIMETHHSLVTMEMYKVYAWDKSGVETVKVTKLFESMIMELESKFRQHKEAVEKDLAANGETPEVKTDLTGIIKNPEIKKLS